MSPRPAPPDPEQNKKIRAAHRKARNAAPAPEVEPVAESPEQPAQTYVVAGRHSVFDVKPGGTVELTPDQAEFLLETGHIALPEPEAKDESAPVTEEVTPPEPGQSPKESGE